MNPKYEFTGETMDCFGYTLRQIEAIENFGDVKKGDIGGWIETEKNLSRYGNAWVSGDARVFGDALVSGDARVSGDAWVSGDTDYLTIGPIGSRGDTTTFYRRRDGGTMVVCGCYHDTIDAFEARVKEVHHGTSHEAAYLAAVACARARVRTDPEDTNEDTDCV